MLLGAHESVAGGAWNAIGRGRADGCEALLLGRQVALEGKQNFAPRFEAYTRARGGRYALAAEGVARARAQRVGKRSNR